MFEITGKDISELNDTDLRTLIARLCEAELRRSGLPISGVTAGGDQNAPDGGLDVRVSLAQLGDRTDFIPRPNTGFQVKKPDMPRSEILNEMRPGGVVRPVIEELAEQGGAYIIVSSKGSTADRSLRDRRNAMAEAVSGLAAANDLFLDFYDRDRVASWARQYPALVSWIRERLGRPMQGWQPFSNWSAPMESMDSTYLKDAKCRIHDCRSTQEEGLTIEDGISRIRTILARPGGTVRLIGLSGLGKTRLAQTLFDSRIGRDSLNPAVVLYTDISDEPNPSPRDVIRHLIQAVSRAIVIVDNCQPSTHRALATACSAAGTQVSLLTIEYDVGEDDPEGTEVFRLEPASDEIIEQLIEWREPQVSPVDRRRIAEFSGGNARVALALARTVRRGESVATLSDRDLFTRLFHQRNSEDTGLLRAAEACSLVYSFDGETVMGGLAELPILAELADQTVDELYRHVRELKARDLVQQRSKWRALLPHALANKLARHALDRLVPNRIIETLTVRAPERLARSFSRRLGYLHDSEVAQSIVTTWLSDGGLLSDLSIMGEAQLAMFYNIAPVAPPATLASLERCLSSSASHIIGELNHPARYQIALLLRSLAFDPELFDRASTLLARFAVAEPPNHNHNATGWLFKELFWMHLSGTHAPLQQRLRIADGFLSASDQSYHECGFSALDAMLETGHFSSSHQFDFGARPRDFGWYPRTNAEISGWFRQVVLFLQEKLGSPCPYADRLRSILASNLRGLWTRASVINELESIVATVAAQGFWNEGWVSVRNTLRFDAQDMPEDILSRLEALERLLRPSHLLEKARAYALSNAWSAFDIADSEEGESPSDVESGYLRVEERTRVIGQHVAITPEVLNQLLPDISTGSDGGRRWAFGMGLAERAPDIRAMWETLVGAVAAVPDGDRNIQTLRGFLAGAFPLAPGVVSDLLDQATSDPVLEPCFPALQCSIAIDTRGVARLLAVAERGHVPTMQFSYLSMGRATDPIADSDLRILLSTISRLPDGMATAVDILFMRLHSLRDTTTEIGNELMACGRELLAAWRFEQVAHRVDHELAGLVEACLAGDDAMATFGVFCVNFEEACADYSTSPYDYDDVIRSIFKVQPKAALSAFIIGQHSRVTRWLIRDSMRTQNHALDDVPTALLIEWASEDASVRFPALAQVIRVFGEREGACTLTTAALALLDAVADPSVILAEYEQRFMPSGWSRSLADVLDARRAAIQVLRYSANSSIVEWVDRWDQELRHWAAQERGRDRASDQSFE